MRAAKISVGNSESLADDRIKSRVAVKTGCKRAQVERMDLSGEETEEEGFHASNAIIYALFTLPQALQFQNRSSQSRAKVPTEGGRRQKETIHVL